MRSAARPRGPPGAPPWVRGSFRLADVGGEGLTAQLEILRGDLARITYARGPEPDTRFERGVAERHEVGRVRRTGVAVVS